MSVTIKLRRGTTAQWSSANPTLALGEVGIDTDLKQLKVGDGATAWSSLAYATAPINSPAFTGTPTAPTANAGTNTTQVATTAFVNTAITNLINGAPGALDTLDELAQALGDDANFATTVTNSLSDKVSKSGGDTITVSSGTTVPLTIQNNGTGNSFVVNDEASDTSPFVVNSSGNIGIGTASPNGAVHISRNATEAVRIETAGTGATPSYYMLASRGTPGSRTALSSGDLTGQIVAWGYNGTDYGQSAVLNFVADGAPSGSTVPGRLEVYTTASGGSPTERIRITSTGRVQLPAGGVLEAPISTNAQTGNYTLILTDAGRLIEMNVGSANNLTVPLNSSVPFPVGTKIDILQVGAGQTTVVATGGVTINANPGLKLSGQWAAASLVKRATDTWVLIGNISV